ncbi:MAG: 5-oxoprolinase subunit PxpB [Clostridium sp.]|nr:5-oxoprolinase subunit PxpB [Clostridium sp.]
MDKFKIYQISETSAYIEFGSEINPDINKKIRILCEYLENKPFYSLVEYIPYFTGMSIIYDPLKVNSLSPFEKVKEKLGNILQSLDFSAEYEEHIVEIPVCYGNEYGPDIEYVAKVNNINIDEVIDIHSKGKYLVYMIGFAPGFPYLGGMSDKIATPRKSTPRTAVPKGSVGIAGMQTGVYPIETPGGWQIIGRTPINLFDADSKEKTLLKCGDIIKFYPISCEEYLKIKGKLA